MDFKPRMQNNSDTNKTKKLSRYTTLQPIYIVAGIVVILIFVVLGYFMYKAGHSKGYDLGLKEGKKQAKIDQRNNPFDIFNRGPGAAGVVETGKVVEFKDDVLTLDNSRGKRIEITVDKETKIKKAGQPFEKSDIKKDMKLSVFTEENDGKLRAKQIIIPKDKKN